VDWLERNGMTISLRTARMFRERADLPLIALFGVTSFEVG